MGFDDWLEAVRLLDKYNGRLLRVANLLSEQAADEQEKPSPPPVDSPAHVREVTPPPVPAAPIAAVPHADAAPTRDTGAGLPKELVATRFKDLLATGKTPAEAAQEAIRHVRASLATPAPAATKLGVPEAAAADGLDDKLRELASMGFVDDERNHVLLKKFAGRMERVVDALCGSSC